MRHFVRHPSSMSVAVQRQHQFIRASGVLIDFAEGGLSFRLSDYVEPGDLVHVRITMDNPLFEADGEVVWCRHRRDAYQMGLRFASVEESYALRMVEQMCHIESYREQQAALGRRLDSDQAALEWIEHFAASFPGLAH